MKWSLDETEMYVTKWPLPADFVWRGRVVRPQHRTLKKGYGFWLRTTPYHRGLFAACHRVLEVCEVFPTGHELAAAVLAQEKAQLGLALEITES